MSDGGKGSKPRPFSVDRKTFDANWDRIFGKKTKQTDNVDADTRTDQQTDNDRN